MNDHAVMTMQSAVPLPGLRAPDRGVLLVHPDEHARVDAEGLRWQDYDGSYYLVEAAFADELHAQALRMAEDPALLQDFIDCDAGGFFATWTLPAEGGSQRVLVITGTSGGSEGMLDPTYSTDEGRCAAGTVASAAQGHLDPDAVDEPAIAAALAAVRNAPTPVHRP